MEKQSVVGLVAAGIEHITDRKPQKKDVLQFIGRTVQLEQRNQAMNYFIGVLVAKMREAGIYTVLVKGQGVGQCYERPLWLGCGDVDFFLDDENYGRAKGLLSPLAVEPEEKRKKHLAMTIDPWLVELHGLVPAAVDVPEAYRPRFASASAAGDGDCERVEGVRGVCGGVFGVTVECLPFTVF